MTELKPCPFCGSRIDDDASSMTQIVCGNRLCGAKIEAFFGRTSIEKWNARASESTWIGIISIKEKLPEINKDILFYHENSFQEKGKLTTDKKWVESSSGIKYDFEQITHWQPLPEPPKEG